MQAYSNKYGISNFWCESSIRECACIHEISESKPRIRRPSKSKYFEQISTIGRNYSSKSLWRQIVVFIELKTPLFPFSEYEASNRDSQLLFDGNNLYIYDAVILFYATLIISCTYVGFGYLCK